MANKVKLQLQLQVQDAGVINGFCYPYARLLLDKAIELKQKGGLFDEVNTAGRKTRQSLTPLGSSVFEGLAEQISGLPFPGGSLSETEFIELTNLAKAYLSIFEP